MALTVEYRRFWCTTSDVAFGPRFESDDQGEAFRSWMYRNYSDARQYDETQLAAYFEEFKSAAVKTDGKEN